MALFRLYGRGRRPNRGRGVLKNTPRPGINTISRPWNIGVIDYRWIAFCFFPKWSKRCFKDHI